MKKGNLILGYASWGFRETPLENQLEIVRRDGLDLLELGIHGHENDYLQLSPSDARIETVKGLFKKYGVKFLCASTGNDFTVADPEAVDKSVSEVKNVIDTAQKLGIKFLRIFAGFSPVKEVDEKRFNKLLSALNEVADYAEKAGVTPVIETHGGVNGYSDGVEHFASVSTDLTTLKKIIAGVSGSVYLNFDPANLSAVGVKDLVAYYKEIEPRVKYLHLKDFKRVGEHRILPTYLGNGITDYTDLLPILMQKDMPALFEYEPVEDIEFGLKKCLEYTLNF